MNKPVHLTKTIAKALIKQELGFSVKEINCLSDTPAAQIYECSFQNFLVRVSNDWYSRNGRLVLQIGDPKAWGWGTIHKSFYLDTLEPDYDADERYWNEWMKEVCGDCQLRRGPRRRGYWKSVSTDSGEAVYECSLCLQEQRQRTKLCPHCWAEMDNYASAE